MARRGETQSHDLDRLCLVLVAVCLRMAFMVTVHEFLKAAVIDAFAFERNIQFVRLARIAQVCGALKDPLIFRNAGIP